MIYLLNIDSIHFERLVHRIYTAELQLNKANASDTESAFLEFLQNYMINGMILIFILLIFRSLVAMSLDVSLTHVYIYISQLIRFDRASSHVNDFNNRNKFLTTRLSVSLTPQSIFPYFLTFSNAF